jgi:hypothetical protein
VEVNTTWNSDDNTILCVCESDFFRDLEKPIPEHEPDMDTKYWGYMLESDGELDIFNLKQYDVLARIHEMHDANFPNTYTCSEGTRKLLFLAPHGTWNKKIVMRDDALEGTWAFTNDDSCYENAVTIYGQ